jgi:hypothetical protein
MQQVSPERVFEHFLLRDAVLFESGALAFCAAFVPALEEGTPVSRVLFHEAGVWSLGPMLGWDAVSLAPLGATPHDPLMVLSKEGTYAIVRDDVIQTMEDIPVPNFGSFRRLRRIDSGLCALGEDRGVFWFDRSGWRRLGEGLPTLDPSGMDEEQLVDAVTSDTELFFSVAGRSESDLHVVGTGGEIWYRENGRWQRAWSPTNLNLMSIAPTRAGDFVVCGQSGTLLRGRADRWDLVPGGAEGSDYASVREFAGDLFLGDGQGTFRLRAGADEVEPVPMAPDVPVPTNLLESAGGRLLAMAGKEVWLSPDGDHWTSLLE